MKFEMISTDITIILPEILLATYAMSMLIAAVYGKKDDWAASILWTTAVVMLGLGAWIMLLPDVTGVAFHSAFIDDTFSRFCKLIILSAAAIVLLLSQEYLHHNNLLKFEFPILIAFAVVGMMIMVSAGDLMALYMGLELQSLALYVIAASRRDSLRSTEAGLKYFVLGALSSGLLLYGISLIYGYAGTIRLDAISASLQTENIPFGLLFGLIFLCVALGFKISAAPFHMWTPDVYEGSPTPVTAFFATAPKMAAAGLFARVLYDGFAPINSDWSQIIAFLSLASMFIGAIAAIGQKNIKRLMSYSSIAHMGFALMGLAAGGEQGVRALLIYMTIYIIMNIGTFTFILNMKKDGKAITDIFRLSLYARHHPLPAAALAVLMFSLAGIPPFLGFFAKLYVLQAAINANMMWLAIAGALASVIGAYYYLRIIYLMYFGVQKNNLNGGMSNLHAVILYGTAIMMLVGIINLFGLENFINAAAATLLK